MAIEWLKGTRYEVMRKIEAECAKCFLYYFHSQLATNKNLDTINSHIRYHPTLQRSWALHSDEELSIYTRYHAVVLLVRPYKQAIMDNLNKLMEDCGFNNKVIHIGGETQDFYAIRLRFPQRIANSSSSQTCYTLEIEDGIAKDMGGPFNKLLTGGDITPPGSSSESPNGRSGLSKSTVESESPPNSPPIVSPPSEWQVVTRRGQGNHWYDPLLGRGHSRGRATRWDT
jgi:hypothetical protein